MSRAATTNSLAGVVADDMAQLIDSWVTYLQAERRYSPHSCKAYLLTLQQALRFFNQHRGVLISINIFSGLSVADWRAWLAHAAATGQRNNSRATALSQMRSFAKWAEATGHFASPALAELQTPRRSAPLPRTLQQPETEKLMLADLPPREALLFALLYATGLRISEALSLRIADIQNQTSVTVTGKGNKQRLVPLLPLLQDLLQKYLPQHPNAAPNAYLFTAQRDSTKPMQPAAAQKIFRTTRAALGLPNHLTPHALRHSYATHLLSNGADLRSLQELLGHASLASTQVYTKLANADLLQTYAAAHPRGK